MFVDGRWGEKKNREAEKEIYLNIWWVAKGAAFPHSLSMLHNRFLWLIFWMHVRKHKEICLLSKLIFDLIWIFSWQYKFIKNAGKLLWISRLNSKHYGQVNQKFPRTLRHMSLVVLYHSKFKLTVTIII